MDLAMAHGMVTAKKENVKKEAIEDEVRNRCKKRMDEIESTIGYRILRIMRIL
jgi:hypothetical protein